MAERILVLRLSSLGDVVLTSTFLRALHDVFPAANVDFVVREDLAPIATALPHVSRVVAVPRGLALPALLDLAAGFARHGYAHVFDLHQSLRSRLLTSRIPGRLRPGFRKQELPRWALIHMKRDLFDRFGGVIPLRIRMLEPLRRMGLHPVEYDTSLVIPDTARAAAHRTLRGARCIALAPGARWPSKRWPAERFAALAERLVASTDRQVVVLGGEAERDVCGIVAAAFPGRSIDLSGRLDLVATAAVLERCQLALTNDSGLAHLTEAVGRPALVLFGATSPRFGYAPYRAASRVLYAPPACSPCSKNGSRPCFRPTHECMENLSVETVYSALAAMLRDEPVAVRTNGV